MFKLCFQRVFFQYNEYSPIKRYNACFMCQKDKETNMLISALDTLDLGADVDHEKFMNTLSESKIFKNFHSGILRFKHLWQ
jgi:hypothetical protein